MIERGIRTLSNSLSTAKSKHLIADYLSTAEQERREEEATGIKI